jgi:hypothetical protein
MSFTDGERRIADEKTVNAPWSGNKKNFRCGLCGHKFVIGDGWRFLFTNDMPKAPGNPLICDSCFIDKDDARAKWQKKHEEINNGAYWWFFRHMDD